ncbi:MAG: hypothetical protein KF753_12170 [Caldilineaceae bacterium]|nr:hypothetical protein [Caldilineaceae bacterium]
MQSRAVRPYLSVALFALVVAASTGSFLRFGLGWGMPAWATNFTAIRHAHSHLMYFGWATLALMALMWHFLSGYTGRALPPGVHWQMRLTSFMAVLSFPAFWINGYGLTQIGSVSLPLGAIASTFNGFTWFYFAWLYRRESSYLRQRPLPVQLWDWAILLLLLSSGGALGLVGMVAAGIQSPFFQQTFLHLFLDLFGVGWFTVALLGLFWAWLGQRAELPRRLPVVPLALAIAPAFFLGVAPALVPTPLFWVAAVANGLAGLLIFWHVAALLQGWMYLSWLMRFGVALLTVHGLTALVVLWPGVWAWSGDTQLRIYFLHNLLLGWVSSTLLALVMDQLGLGKSQWLPWLGWIWIGGVGVMLLALLGLGMLQFVPFSALFLLRVAAWSTPALVGVAGAVWLLSLRRGRAGTSSRTTHNAPQNS